MEPNDCRYQNKYRYFQEQCFLTELWAAGKFDNYKTEVVNDSTLDGLLDTPSLPTFSTPEKKETIELQIDKKKLHGYENFTILETSEHKEILKLLSENKALDMQTFGKFKPHHLSALVPRLRLYKVYFSQKGKNPLVSIPFYFPSSLENPGGLESSSARDFKEALLLNDFIGNVGITSFNWELQGVNPATIDYSISASLGIFLQQLSDLDQALPIDSRTQALLNSLEGSGYQAPSYKDLLLPAKSRGIKTTTIAPGGNQEHVPDHFKIKAEIGWELPTNPENFFSDLTKNELEEFKAAIKNSVKTLILNTIDHTINFAQDGTVNIQISYQAAFEADMQSPDAEILTDKELRKEIDSFNSFEQETLKRIRDIRKNSGLAKDRKRKQSEKIFAKFKNVEKKFQDYLKQKQSFLYKNLIKNVEDRGRVFHTLYDTKAIAAVWQSESPAGITIEYPKGTKTGSKFLAGLKQQVYSKYAAKIRNQYAKSLNKKWPEHLLENVLKEGKTFFRVGELENTKRLNKLNQMLAEAKTAAQKKKIKKRIKNASTFKVRTNIDVSGIRWTKKYTLDSKGKKTPSAGRPYYELTFFFLGDLINSAIQIAKENSNSRSKFFENTDFMFGPVQYYDPRLNNGAGGYRVINLADIPISYSLFRDWFANTVVKGNLKTYKLFQFFKDIFSGFLRDALGGKCYDALSFHGNPTLVGLHHFATKEPSKKSRSNPLKNIGSSDSKWISNNADFGRVPLTARLINTFSDNSAQKGAAKTHNWIVFYVASNRVSIRTGSISQDLADGIPHFYIGSDTGILKTMSFQKENWKYFKEQRILQKSGYERLGQPYSVNITVFGNNYFRPGQYIYINPRRPGITSDIGKQLLLEGYYLIIKVSSSFSNGNYETSISAKYEDTGLNPKKKGFDLQSVNVPPIERRRVEYTSAVRKSSSTNRKKKNNQQKKAKKK